MEWTKEWPTKPGWYWMYDTLFHEPEPEVVRCDATGCVYDTFSGEVYPSVLANTPYMFKGPIEIPSASKSPHNA